MNSYIHKIVRGATFFASAVFLTLGMNAAHAKVIKKQNLLDLMKYSDSILVGTISDKTDGFYKGLPYTEITVKVGQNIKGNHGESYTFRQFGLIKPRTMDNGRVNLMVTPAGWPTYTKGEQVMLFLYKPASETGFQTTAGLTQGKFSIRGDLVANDTGNDALFAGVKFNGKLSPAQQDLVKQASGAFQAQTFFNLVKTAVDEQWIENGVMTNEK